MKPLPRNRRAGVALLVGPLVTCLALSACTTGATSTASGHSSGTSASKSDIVVVTAATPDSLAWDASAGNNEANDLEINTQATLVRHPYVKDTKSGQLHQDLHAFEGVLATGYTTSSDGLTYTFALRKNVKSAAGNPLTAADVIWSFKRKLLSGLSLSQSLLAPALTSMSQIKEVNAMTVSFTVAKPGYGPELMAELANIPGEIDDSTLLRAHTTTKDPYAIQWSAQPANVNYGYGAYTMSGYVADQQMVLTANPNYPLAAPKITKITYRVAADAGTRANTLTSGDADMATELLPADQATLAGKKGFAAPQYDQSNTYTTLFTVNDTKGGGPFSNKLVRQAMAYAIPYKQIIQNVYHGRAVQLQGGYEDTTAPGYSSAGLPSYTYDPAKAKALLAKAGVKTPIKVTFNELTAPPDQQQTAIQIQSAAKAAGFDITIKTVQTTAFYEGIDAHTYAGYVWSGGLYGASQLLNLQAPYPVGAPRSNLSGYTNPTFTALVNKAAGLPITDTAELNAIYTQANQILGEDLPIINIVSIPPGWAMRSGLTGVAYRAEGGLDYSQMTAS